MAHNRGELNACNHDENNWHNRGERGGHSHSRGGDNIGLAFFLNLSFTAVELIGGLLTNSIAILSDAIHDFGDSLSLALAWYFQKKSRKGSTDKYTYGYKRFSLLGAVITSAVLVVGSVIILTEAVPRLLSPQETDAAGMLWLAVLGIIVNGAAVLRTRKGNSINERVVSLHLFEDALGWAAVLAGAFIMYLTGFTVIDPILSIVISCFVIFNVAKNIRQVIPIVLQGSPSGVERERIASRLKEIKQVHDIHDLHIWALDEENNVLTAHIILNETMPMEELAVLKTDIRNALKEESIQHATLEFEAPSESCSFTGCAR